MKGRALFWMAAVATVAFTAFYIGLQMYVGTSRRATTVVEAGPAAIDVPLPEVTLTDMTGEPMTIRDLQGGVWIVDCIFTRCPGPCLRMTEMMAALQTELAGDIDIRFLSVSVDPEFDTPAVLADYANKHGADPSRWKFVTGEKARLHDFIRQGLRLALKKLASGESSPDGPIIHSTKFILLDRDAHVRGYYEGLDAEARAALVRDARKLAAQ